MASCRWLPSTPSQPQRTRGLSRLVALALCLLAPLCTISVARAAPAAAPTLVYAQHPCIQVVNAPSLTAQVLTTLLGGNDLMSVGTATSADGATWDHVKFWSGVDGYVRASDLGPKPPAKDQLGGESVCPPFTPGVDLPVGNGPWPLIARGHFIAPTAIFSSPTLKGFPTGEVSPGAQAAINQWAADADDEPWYHITTGATDGWVQVSAISIDMPDLATYKVNGAPVWQPVAGKGMWLKNFVPHHSDVTAMVQAAKLAGITHLYVEVAFPSGGFFAQDTLNRLLPVAHAAGIKIISTVYDPLENVASGIRLAVDVAQYKTPSGEQADGIAMDMENDGDPSSINMRSVYAYGQVIRALLGANTLMVANVIPPLSHAPYAYPYEAVAASWNVISPMDYWHHDPRHTYTANDAHTYVAASLTALRAVVGPTMPIEELGQMYDMTTDPYGSVGGTGAPAAAEIVADLQTAQHLGCIGTTFYTWQTATQAQWQALVNTPW